MQGPLENSKGRMLLLYIHLNTLWTKSTLKGFMVRMSYTFGNMTQIFIGVHLVFKVFILQLTSATGGVLTGICSIAHPNPQVKNPAPVSDLQKKHP